MEIARQSSQSGNVAKTRMQIATFFRLGGELRGSQGLSVQVALSSQA
jgi:hypothetical protein